MKDIIIIGAGPGGLTAAMYAGRAELKVVLIEKNFQGGQMINTNEVENYPGMLETTGLALSHAMYEHARHFGAEIVFEEVLEIKVEESIKKVITTSNTYEAKTLILAMGAKPRQLGLINERELWGRGVSYCAICDGGFYRDKVVAVVGGGDTAVEDALYLSRFAQKVYLIYRRDALRANKSLQRKLFDSSVEILWNSNVIALYADDTLTGIDHENVVTKEITHLDIRGLFIAVGSDASTELVKDIVALDKQGYIIADENCISNVEGVFAVGDIRQKQLRQIITAAADGAISVYEAEKYILNKDKF